MPTFVYLAPLTLFFLIGPASATIATLIYAAPPAIRITAHAIRSVPRDDRRGGRLAGRDPAADAARRCCCRCPSGPIVLGVNQTIMAALSMVTIAALIDAPGLGKTVVKALQTLDVGTAFNAGLAIVVMAIVLDRVTTAASARAEARPAFGRAASSTWRRPLLAAGAVVTAVLRLPVAHLRVGRGVPRRGAASAAPSRARRTA